MELSGRNNIKGECAEPIYRYPKGCRIATLISREKRFFINAVLDGKPIIAHTNNTGSMLGLLRKGAPILLSPAANPKRKLAWTLEAVGLRQNGNTMWVGVNTQMPNMVLSLLFHKGMAPWMAGYTELKREATNGESRLDGVLTAPNLPPLWVECKNVTLSEDNVAAFPDAVTTRGAKHLHTLMRLKKAGDRAAMLYVVQRTDAACFSAADYIDPAYADALEEAQKNGVEIHPLMFRVAPDGIYFVKELETVRC